MCIFKVYYAMTVEYEKEKNSIFVNNIFFFLTINCLQKLPIVTALDQTQTVTWSNTVPFQMTWPPPSFQTCWILQPTMLRRGWDRTLVVGPKLLLCFLPGQESAFRWRHRPSPLLRYSLVGVLLFHHICRDPCMLWGDTADCYYLHTPKAAPSVTLNPIVSVGKAPNGWDHLLTALFILIILSQSGACW